MHIKDFFNIIQHRFRNAHVLDDDMVEADLINHADEIIGKLLYEIKNDQEVKGIECYIGDKNYAWGETISDCASIPKTFTEILSIIRGLLESKNTVELLDDSEAEKIIDSYKTTDIPTVEVGEGKEYTVSISVTFSSISKSATMDAALAELRGRLKLPNNVQYKITNESVEIKHQ